VPGRRLIRREELRGLVDERNGVTKMLNGRQRCIVWPSLVAPGCPAGRCHIRRWWSPRFGVGMTGCLSLE
jgi:hypothetical protein